MVAVKAPVATAISAAPLQHWIGMTRAHQMPMRGQRHLPVGFPATGLNGTGQRRVHPAVPCNAAIFSLLPVAEILSQLFVLQ
jgi:hypothetical protein